MYELDLDSCKDLKPCRGYYQVGDAYCAMGKLLKGLGFEIPAVTGDGFIIPSVKTSDFIVEVGKKLGDLNWMQAVSEINDAPGSLKDNHEKAFRLAVNKVIDSGLVTVKNMEEKLPIKELMNV